MAKMGLHVLSFLAISALALPGCATVIRGTKETNTFQSNPAGARVTVTSTSSQKEGPFSCRTPCTLNLKRKRTWLVRYELDGYKSVEAYLDSKLSGAGMGWAAGSVVGAGVIGAGIDIGTGATQKLTPNPMIAKLEPLTSVAESTVLDAQYEPVAVATSNTAQPPYKPYQTTSASNSISAVPTGTTRYSFRTTPTEQSDATERKSITWP